MINYYKRSKKAFKQYIKNNKYCTQEEWDNYAHKNNLFSSFTLECHEISDNALKLLMREDEDIFQYLKEIFIIVPSVETKTLNKIIKINKEKNKIGETNEK